MSNTQNFFCRHRNRHLLISMLFLLVSSFTHHRITMAQGRPIFKLLEEADQKSIAVRVKQIGSRPPRCERRCRECARCEAVQVPVQLQRLSIIKTKKTTSKSSLHSNNSTKYVYSSKTDFSNYKPMSWKCKCGNFLFNP